MNRDWQQPNRALEMSYKVNEGFVWVDILFIRPTEIGIEVISQHGNHWSSSEINLRVKTTNSRRGQLYKAKRDAIIMAKRTIATGPFFLEKQLP